MKHLANIQIDFVKLAMHWSEMDHDQQQEYLNKHRKSKRRINARPDVSGFRDYVRRKRFVNLETGERVKFHKLPVVQQEKIRLEHEKQYYIDKKEREEKLEQQRLEKQKQDDVFKQDVNKQIEELTSDDTVIPDVEEELYDDAVEKGNRQEWIGINKQLLQLLINMSPEIVSDEDFIGLDKLIRECDEEGDFTERQFNQIRKYAEVLRHKYLTDKALIARKMQDRLVKLSETVKKSPEIVNDSLYKRLKEIVDKFREIDKDESSYLNPTIGEMNSDSKANTLYAKFDVILKMLNQKYQKKM